MKIYDDLETANLIAEKEMAIKKAMEEMKPTLNEFKRRKRNESKKEFEKEFKEIETQVLKEIQDKREK